MLDLIQMTRRKRRHIRLLSYLISTFLKFTCGDLANRRYSFIAKTTTINPKILENLIISNLCESGQT